VRPRNRTRQLKETFAGLPLAVQFVLALTALIAAGLAAAIGVDWYGVYAETHGPLLPLLIGGAVLIASVTAFFVWANGATKRQHARVAAEDVQSAIENCLCLHDTDHDEWDLFLAYPIADSYLESVRQRCIQIWDAEPVEPRLRQQLDEILRELRSRGSW
jgi:hypothetical protein